MKTTILVASALAAFAVAIPIPEEDVARQFNWCGREVEGKPCRRAPPDNPPPWRVMCDMKYGKAYCDKFLAPKHSSSITEAANLKISARTPMDRDAVEAFCIAQHSEAFCDEQFHPLTYAEQWDMLTMDLAHDETTSSIAERDDRKIIDPTPPVKTDWRQRDLEPEHNLYRFPPIGSSAPFPGEPKFDPYMDSIV